VGNVKTAVVQAYIYDHVETAEPCITIQVDYETDLCKNYT